MTNTLFYIVLFIIYEMSAVIFFLRKKNKIFKPPKKLSLNDMDELDKLDLVEYRKQLYTFFILCILIWPLISFDHH